MVQYICGYGGFIEEYSGQEDGQAIGLMPRRHIRPHGTTISSVRIY